MFVLRILAGPDAGAVILQVILHSAAGINSAVALSRARSSVIRNGNAVAVADASAIRLGLVNAQRVQRV
jgi:hypothetical protein